MRLRGWLVLALVLVAGVAKGGPVQYTRLIPYLVDMPGWEGEKPMGMTMGASDNAYSIASRHYTKGNKVFDVGVLCGSAAKGAMVPIQMGINTDTPEVHMETTTYRGFKAGFNYQKKEKRGAAVIQLSTSNPPAAFVVEFQGMDLREARGLLDHFDMKGLALAIH